MIEVIVGCLFPLFLTPSTLVEYQECRTTKVKVESVVYFTDLVSTYFKEDDILQALNIIYCESSGKPNALGVNKNGTKDVGLWQFNDNTWAWLKSKLDIISNRTNPKVSTAVASWLVYNDGWHHWNSSKHCWKDYNNRYLYMEETN
jgi:hypothetical protein